MKSKQLSLGDIDRLALLLETAVESGQLSVGFYKANGSAISTSDHESRIEIIDQGELMPESLEITLPVDSLMQIMKFEIMNRITNPEP